MERQEIAVLHTCVKCGFQARLTYSQLIADGWYWERRVGHWYDYYCPSCAQGG